MGLRLHWGWVVILGCWGASVSTHTMADEYAKQPPLEIPKALLDGEPPEHVRPDPVKKSGSKSEAKAEPKAADAVAKSDTPAKAAKSVKANGDGCCGDGDGRRPARRQQHHRRQPRQPQ